ncbi:MAG: helix-turn-helix domain-containing protein [Pseudomonadota bacterium]
MRCRNLSETIALYIMSCPTEELTQLTRYSIAEIFQVNKSYLSRRFKEDLNLSLSSYIDQEKAVRSRILMAAMERTTVEEIAQRLGIAKPQQFRAKFRQIFHTTPGRFIRSAGKAK